MRREYSTNEPTGSRSDRHWYATRPIRAYGGVCLTDQAVEQIAASLTSGTVPMHKVHEAAVTRARRRTARPRRARQRQRALLRTAQPGQAEREGAQGRAGPLPHRREQRRHASEARRDRVPRVALVDQP